MFNKKVVCDEMRILQILAHIFKLSATEINQIVDYIHE